MIGILNNFKNKPKDALVQQYNLRNSRDWTVDGAIKDVIENFPKIQPSTVNYRPFDSRFTFYTGNARKFIGTPSYPTMRHILEKENTALICCKQQSTYDFAHIFITKKLVDRCLVSSASKETGYVAPLYLYPNTHDQMELGQTETRTPNLNMDIVEKIVQGLGLKFAPEKSAPPLEGSGEVAPIDLLDYIYAVLHSPTYRQKYKEFLKIDFPRVPYPKNADTFWQLVQLGSELRQIHLLESPVVETYLTKYPIDGDNVVGKIRTSPSPSKGGGLMDVYINDVQYFANVPEVAWNFYIGGYQPAQKWLKDRKDRKLEFEDILHYQKIITALYHTDRIMKEIDKIEIES